MRINATPILFGLILFLIVFGTLFKIQHWPFAEILLMFAALVQPAFLICVLIEIGRSNVAEKNAKTAWLATYVLILLLSLVSRPLMIFFMFSFYPSVVLGLTPFFAGAIYLIVGRKKFAPKVRAIDKITFDSI